MKQNIKKVWLILSMIICLAAVSGCAAASDTDKELDPSVVMTMQQGAQQYLALFSSLTDEQLDQYIIQSEENKDYVMENMEFTLIVSDDMSEITGMSFTPEYTIAEKMAKAAMNTLIGMGVVFLVLIFISWIISLFKYINVFEAKMKGQEKQEKPAAPARAAAPAPAPVQPAPAPAPAAAPVQAAAPAVSNAAPAYEYEDVSGDLELISVIAAAIAASEGKSAANGLVVRSIKRVSRRSWR